jgi:hypothetical protein
MHTHISAVLAHAHARCHMCVCHTHSLCHIHTRAQKPAQAWGGGHDGGLHHDSVLRVGKNSPPPSHERHHTAASASVSVPHGSSAWRRTWLDSSGGVLLCGFTCSVSQALLCRKPCSVRQACALLCALLCRSSSVAPPIRLALCVHKHSRAQALGAALALDSQLTVVLLHPLLLCPATLPSPFSPNRAPTHVRTPDAGSGPNVSSGVPCSRGKRGRRSGCGDAPCGLSRPSVPVANCWCPILACLGTLPRIHGLRSPLLSLSLARARYRSLARSNPPA